MKKQSRLFSIFTLLAFIFFTGCENGKCYEYQNAPTVCLDGILHRYKAEPNGTCWVCFEQKTLLIELDGKGKVIPCSCNETGPTSYGSGVYKTPWEADSLNCDHVSLFRYEIRNRAERSALNGMRDSALFYLSELDSLKKKYKYCFDQ